MEEQNRQPLDTLKDIKQMMERSSRFISLSGLSGIAAGICGLVGAWIAERMLNGTGRGTFMTGYYKTDAIDSMSLDLLLLAAAIFAAAFILAFLFTWLRSKKTNIPIWGLVARRLMWSVAIPLVAGAIFLYRMIDLKQYELIAPGCLLFYGLALVNASRYTLNEIRYMGYTEILLGLISCWYTGYGLQFWAIGFGVLHIIYGAIMWWKYERKL